MSKLRKSNYTILIAYESLNIFTIVHGISGAVDLIDKKLFKLIESKSYNKISPSKRKFLEKRGYLTTKTKNNEIDFAWKLSNKLNYDSQKLFFVFLITYNCNLNCSYCFEKKYINNNNSNKIIFSYDKVDLAFQAIDDLKKINKIDTALHLYGGEPLTKKNINIIEYIIKNGIDRGFRFEVVSNGVEVDNYINFVPNHLPYFQISLHENTSLLDKKGKVNIGKNINKLLLKGAEVGLRINLTTDNIDKILNEVQEAIEFWNWNNNPKFYSYFSPIRSINNRKKNNYKIFNNKIVNFNNKNIKYKLPNLVGAEINLEFYVKELLENKLSLKSQFCSASNLMHIFDPYGKIYSCWEAVGSDKYVLGEFAPRYKVNYKEINRWVNSTIMDKKKCRTCSYAFFCGGGCTFQDFEINNTLQGYCEHFKDMFKNELLKYIQSNIKT